MRAEGRGGRAAWAMVVAVGVGCGARGGGGAVTADDVPVVATDRGAAMDAGVPPVDVGVPPVDVGVVVDLGMSIDVGAPVDRGVVSMDVGGCVASGAEGSAAACADGADNDCDGFRDCTDPECSAFCGGPIDSGVRVDTGGRVDVGCVRSGNEDNTVACADGLDNDCDGYFDCVDFNCQRASVPFCPSDGGVRVDTGCVATSENSNATCGDGLDNDCDGFTDCRDRSCTTTCVVTVCPSDAGARDAGSCVCRGVESTLAACSNGVDDDCDGFLDCNDFDCSMNSATATLCRDGG